MKNNDGIIPKLILIGIVLLVLALQIIPGENALYKAPIASKIFGWIPLVISFFSFRALFRDNLILSKWVKNENVAFYGQMAIGAAFAVLGFLIMAVWHSGPLGLSTNNY